MPSAPTPPTPPHLAVLEGVLERVTYANEENGYTVARVDTGRGGDLLTVVGSLLGAQPGESLRMEGRWGSHPQYGKQFTVENYTTVLPATIQGIRRYLGSGLIKGIGPVMADRITTHFGTETLDIIENAPKRLVEVPGLGPKRTKKIADAWEEQKAIKEVMIFLQSVGVSTSIAVRIYKKYEDASISVVKNQPYRLAADVWGIGFLTADRIAQAVGIPHDSPERVRAGLQYALSQSCDQGHCYLPEERLIADGVKLLQVDTGLVIDCLAELAADPEGVVREKVPSPEGGEPVTAVYLVPFHRAELSLAGQVRRLLRTPEDRMPAFRDVDWEKALEWLARRTGATLAPEQEAAVRLALSRKVAVLTGGPGCGKSFTVRSVVELARAKKAKVVLAAPTGRAAKRLSELTGAEASTVHRLLELKPGGDAAYDRDRPLDADLVVVDEASMLDLLLANKLVKAVAPGAHLLLVGDVDQLPSVGAGEVLRDLLAEGGPVPAVRLTRIFRQAQHSGVVTNAHRINSGQPPLTHGLDDFFLFVEDETEDAGVLAVDVAARRLPRKFGLDPRRDIQVLTPMHRGLAGCRSPQHPAPAGHHAGPPRVAGEAVRRPGLPGRRQGDPDPQQLRQGGERCLQRHPRRRDLTRHRRAAADRAHRRGRGDRLRLRRAGRAGARLRHDDPSLPGQRVPGRRRPRHHQRLDDAPAQPPLHGGDAGQEARRPRRFAEGDRAGGPHGFRREALHGTGFPASRRVRGRPTEKMIDQIGGKHHGGLPDPQGTGQDD